MLNRTGSTAGACSAALAIKPAARPATTLALLCAACMPGLVPQAHAATGDDYPARPIRIVVGFAPGGGTDLMARTMATKLGEAFSSSVFVEYKPAQSGIVGAQFVARAAPDGYTLIMGTTSTFGVGPSLYSNPGYDPVKDFAPVVLCSTLPNVLVVHQSVPAKSVKELVALAKSQPGKLNFASSGSGGGGHVAGELFKLVAGIDMLHIPYKGTSQAASDLIAGNVNMSFVTIIPTLPHIKTGRLRALAVTSPKRAQALPDVPTFAEAGVPGVVATSWNGVLATGGTPRPVIDRLNAEMVKILGSAELVQNLAAQGAEQGGGSPDEFAQFIRAEVTKWAKVVKAAGLRVD